MDKVREIAILFNIPNEYIILFGISVIGLLIIKRRDAVLCQAILYPTVGVILCVINPLLIGIMDALIGNLSRYVRIYWLLPIIIVLGISAVMLGDLASDEKKKWGIYGLVCLLLAFTGIPLFTKQNFARTENVYKLPQEAIEICEMFPENTKDIRIVVPPTLSPYIRQYDGNIRMLHGRYINWEKPEIYQLMEQKELDIPYITKYSRTYSCDYVVMETTKPWNDSMESWGFEEKGRAGDYILYRDVWNDGEGMSEEAFKEYGGVSDGDIYVLLSGTCLMVYNLSDEAGWVLVQELNMEYMNDFLYEKEKNVFQVINDVGEIVCELKNVSGVLQ